jgi:hypothetical protein
MAVVSGERVCERLGRCTFLLQFLRFDQEHPYVVHVDPRVGEKSRAELKLAAGVTARPIPITAFVLPYSQTQSAFAFGQVAKTDALNSSVVSGSRIGGAERLSSVGASMKPVQWKVPMPPQRKSGWGFGHIEGSSVTRSVTGLSQLVYCDDQEAMRRLLW